MLKRRCCLDCSGKGREKGVRAGASTRFQRQTGCSYRDPVDARGTGADGADGLAGWLTWVGLRRN